MPKLLPTAPLLLVAASGLARETATAAQQAGHRVIGILDENADLWGSEVGGLPVLGGLGLVAEHSDAALVLCAGKGSSRRAIAARLSRAGVEDARYATVVHPRVDLPSACSVGPGSVLLSGVVLTADVCVGRHVVCMPSVVLTHDCVVDDYATLCAGVVLGGTVRIGSEAYVGMSASVREGSTIGAGAVIGMGSVVLADVPPGQTWAGVPARSLSPRG